MKVKYNYFYLIFVLKDSCLSKNSSNVLYIYMVHKSKSYDHKDWYKMAASEVPMENYSGGYN